MASSFNVFKINGNILTVNGVDYALDVVATGLASTSNSSFGTIKAIDNGDDTITLTINDKMLIVNKHVDYDGVLMTFNDEILVEDGGLALEVSEEVSLISFTIDGTSYQAEQGMTWAQWVASNYNADGYNNIIDYIELIENGEEYLVGDSNKPYADNYGRVSPSDIIVSDRSYHLAYMGPAPKEYY